MGSDKIRTFKDLDAWKEGHVLVLLIYKLTKQFPKDEVFGLVSQMRRAAVSITSNIAEGFARSSFKEKAQFYSIAKGSVTELENQLLISKDIGYITANEFISTEEKALRVNRIVHGLIQGSKKFLLLALFLIPYSIFFLSAPSVHAAARLQMPPNYLRTNSGLVGYWTMDGKNTNWGSNTTNDLSGNSNTGTMTNMSTTSSPAAGKIGQALNFDGVDDYVQTPITDLNFSGGTVSWWQKSNRAFNDNAAIQAPWGQMTNGNIIPEFTAQKFTDGNWYVGWNRSGDNDRVSIAATAANWPQNTWSYYTFTWVSGGDSVLYQNGVQIGSKIGGTTVSTIVDNFVIGRQGRTHSAFFDGLIDEVRVYNRALSVDEIQSLYNSGR